MPYEEEQLNGRIASIIRRLTRDLGWDVREEARGVLLEERLRKPDIVILRNDAPPVIIENEYTPGSTLELDCLSRLGRTLEADSLRGSGKVSVVFALRSPSELRDCANGDEADVMLRNGVDLEFAVYRGKPDDHSRFPKSGFLRGDIRNLVNFIKPASIPEDIVSKAADALTRGANVAASIITSYSATRYNFGATLGEKLRQPWPATNDIPNSKAELRQAKADEEARLQTAKMCATMLINALAYQQSLSNHHPDIADLSTVRELEGYGELNKDILIKQWNTILEINYWPIFHIARELLLDLPTQAVGAAMPSMIDTASAIQVAMRQNDIAGIVFQRLIADRKTLKTYYTRSESTVLAAHLGVHDDIDWSNPETVRNYRIADYACGTGGLVLAAYQRVRDLHRAHGGNPDQLHSYMMEHSLTACDIMPAAVHLSSSLLSSVAPGETYEGTRHILYPFGGVKRRGERGDVVKDTDGNPILESDSDGQPVVHIGSLELLDLTSTKRQVVLPINEQMALGAKGKRLPIEVDMVPLSQDLVIMNPPFTRPTKHAPFDTEDHVDPRNPAFAAFGTSDAEQQAMKRKERALGRNTISDGNAGLGTTFTAIADNMVKSGGRIALILPTSAMMGGSYDAAKNQAYSWQRLRGLLYGQYDEIVVVSIAQPKKMDSAFSADSNLADCILVARRSAEPATRDKSAHFVNLRALPSTQLEAQETARSIKLAVRQTTHAASYEEIRIGDEVIGFVSLETIHPHRKWTAIRLSDPILAARIRQFARGELNLPQRAGPIKVPVCNLGAVGNVGPVHRDIIEGTRGPFKKIEGSSIQDEYPMLWSHAPVGKNRGRYLQDTMLTQPDSHGVVKDGRTEDAAKMWRNATHLHINAIFGFNANSTAAAFTERRSLGGAAWPTLTAANVDHEKALCVWFNGTLGMASYWLESNRSQDGRGHTTVTSMPSIPVLDMRALTPQALAAAVAIFDDLQQQVMLPANEAYRDPVRQELDRRILTEVLMLDDESVEQLAILRNQWCAEPTVTGTKKTGIQFNT